MRNKIARDILRLSKELLAIDFSTKDQLDKYLKKHPGADKSKHKIVKNKDNVTQNSMSDKKVKFLIKRTQQNLSADSSQAFRLKPEFKVNTPFSESESDAMSDYNNSPLSHAAMEVIHNLEKHIIENNPHKINSLIKQTIDEIDRIDDEVVPKLPHKKLVDGLAGITKYHKKLKTDLLNIGKKWGS